MRRRGPDLKSPDGDEKVSVSDRSCSEGLLNQRVSFLRALLCRLPGPCVSGAGVWGPRRG